LSGKKQVGDQDPQTDGNQDKPSDYFSPLAKKIAGLPSDGEAHMGNQKADNPDNQAGQTDISLHESEAQPNSQGIDTGRESQG